ncbi:MAG: hypothetical protein HY905_07920 [Deltaproteobacteria bacterium]|nr:hypothetical protein [Deltaproteobacteria bacterium]
MLVRLSASVSVAFWSVFLPLALDLAHPVFSDCGSHRRDAASGDEPAAVAAPLGATRNDAPIECASDGNCPVHGVPERSDPSCCGDGDCLCCGGVALLPLAARLPPAAVRSASIVTVVDRLAEGVSRTVFHPPRS